MAERKVYTLKNIKDSLENCLQSVPNAMIYLHNEKSYNENVPCVYGKYWWQLGYGSSNPQLLEGEDNYIREIRGCKGLFVDVDKYHDTFRVKNYPSKVIRNRKELRRWMKKRYFELEDWQLEMVSEFFRENPDGVITFG